mgnify:CR=1 FL=1
MHLKNSHITKALSIITLLLISVTSHSQCTWTEVDFEGFEYATACPDLIGGTTYHPIPSTYSAGQHSGNTYMYMNFVTGLAPGSLVYERFYNVCPGQQYQTSSWYIGLNNSTSNITLRIVDGNGLVLDTWSGSSVSGVYNNHISNIVIPTTTTISFQLISDGAPGNNDMGFDDLSLSSCITSSEDEGTITLCPSNASINLHDSLTTISGTGGVWTGPSGLSNSFQGTFDPTTNVAGVYTYTVGNGINCVDSVAFFNLVISSAPDLTTTPVSACPATNGDITSSFVDNNATGGTVTYWQDVLATTPEPNPTNIATAGTYYIVMDAGGCTDTASVIVTFQPQPTINLGNDTDICHNQALILDAGPGFNNYLWSDGSTNQTLNINSTVTDTFWVQGVNLGGNIVSNSDFTGGTTSWTDCGNLPEVLATSQWHGGVVPFVPNNFAEIDAGIDQTVGNADDASLCQNLSGLTIGSNYTLCLDMMRRPGPTGCTTTWGQPSTVTTLLAIDNGALNTSFSSTATTWAWTNICFTFTATSTTHQLTLNPNDPSSCGMLVRNIIISGCNSTATDTIIVNVDPGPNVIITPNNNSYCVGEPVPASAYVSDSTGVTFNWLNNNTSTGLGASNTGNTPMFNTTNALTISDTSTISVWAELNNCPGDTTEYLIIVNPLPAPPTINDTLICTNNSVTLTPTAPGGIYEWFDAAIGGNSLAIGSSYTTPVLTANDTFWVESTIDGCTGSRKQINVTIGNGLVVDAGLDVDICNGMSAILNATPTTTGNMFSWTEPGGAVIQDTANPTVTPTDTTLYQVVVTDMFGCVGIDSVTVNVKPTPVVTVPNDSSFCNGEFVPTSFFTSVPVGASYTWTNSNTAVGLSSTIGSSIIPGFNSTNPSTQTINSTISVTPTYLSCTGNPVDFIVTVQPTPTITTPADITYCIGDIVPASHIGGTPSGVDYDWTNSNTSIGLGASGIQQDVPSFTATNTTNFSESGIITVTPYANGCFGNPINYTITVSAPITIDKSIIDVKCYGGNDGSVTAFPSGGTPNYSYSWSSGSTDSVASNLSAGPVTLTVTDVNNCTQDSTFIITEPDSIDYISFYAEPLSGCSPLEVDFTCTINPTQHLVKNYVWNFGNNLVPVDSFEASSIYTTPGTYDVSLTISDFSGCSNTLTIEDYITVYEDPEAHFNTFPENPTMFNPTVNFSDASYPNVVGWEWLFDTLGNSNYQNPDFTFPEDSGNYLVTLIVEDDNTCKDTLTKNVFIRSEIALFLPNSFTPNGDGLNDTFTPKGFGIALNNYSFLIFNRWGELVFETNNVLEGWDGSYNGELLPSGVYVWRADFLDLNGKAYRRKGQMTIIR